MKPWDYFNWLKTLNYVHAGFGADYDVQRINNDVYVSFKETTGWFDWIMNILFIPFLLFLPFSFQLSFLQPVFIGIVIIQMVFLIIFVLFYFPKKPYKNMEDVWRVHFGMALIYGSIRDDLLDKIKHQLNEGCKNIYVGGWSQGGGISQLCAEDCFFQFNIKPTLTTFGSLRVAWGNVSCEHIAQSCSEESKCYENSSDFIPHVPLKIWGFKNCLSYHIGEKFHLLKAFNTSKYHKQYGDESIYNLSN